MRGANSQAWLCYVSRETNRPEPLPSEEDLKGFKDFCLEVKAKSFKDFYLKAKASI